MQENYRRSIYHRNMYISTHFKHEDKKTAVRFLHVVCKKKEKNVNFRMQCQAQTKAKVTDTHTSYTHIIHFAAKLTPENRHTHTMSFFLCIAVYR